MIFTPVSLCKAVQNLDTKSLSWSEIISLERPFSQYQLLKNMTGHSKVFHTDVSFHGYNMNVRAEAVGQSL